MVVGWKVDNGIECISERILLSVLDELVKDGQRLPRSDLVQVRVGTINKKNIQKWVYLVVGAKFTKGATQLEFKAESPVIIEEG